MFVGEDHGSSCGEVADMKYNKEVLRTITRTGATAFVEYNCPMIHKLPGYRREGGRGVIKLF